MISLCCCCRRRYMTLCRRGIFRALRWRWSWRSWPLRHIGELPRRERAASLSSCDDGGTTASYAVGIYSSRRIARAVWSGSISWRSWRCRRPTSARYRNSAVAVLWRAAFQSTWGRIVGEVDERAKSGFLGETSALLFPVNWPEAVAEQLANHRLWHWAMRRSCLCRQINEMDQRQDVDGVVVPELQGTMLVGIRCWDGIFP